ncbi:MAG: DNA-3-methyladenine glycosylase 2 family protein [Oscillospiraceae bacterium]|nr:DNA-3-methyladenine glycosylase 2 family protein [Oscillospiraceae bacterium]
METLILQLPGFSAEETFSCGQCFRWRKAADGGYDGFVAAARVWATPVAQGLRLESERPLDPALMGGYFCEDVDYSELFRCFKEDEMLSRAIEYAPGIRVLRQPLFETLLSFIISQNNNIPRISGIIERFCDCFGAPCGDRCAFPQPYALAAADADALRPLRCGFRERYLLDAIRCFCSGEIDGNSLRSLPLAQARAQLMRINGVGPKIADCTLLFGAGRWDAFPQDVWIKRMMSEYYPNGLPDYILPYAGIAQQYLFHYARTSGLFCEKHKQLI